jgi:hypothetical protein
MVADHQGREHQGRVTRIFHNVSICERRPMAASSRNQRASGDGGASRLMSSGYSPADAATVTAPNWVSTRPNCVNALISRCTAKRAATGLAALFPNL